MAPPEPNRPRRLLVFVLLLGLLASGAGHVGVHDAEHEGDAECDVCLLRADAPPQPVVVPTVVRAVVGVLEGVPSSAPERRFDSPESARGPPHVA